MWQALAALFGIGLAAITLWVQNESRIRKRKLWDRIHDIQRRADEAMVKHDMVALADALRELRDLKTVQASLKGK